MKILIAYTCAGAGHRRSAEAIYNYLSANYPKLDIRIVDVLDYTTALFKNLYSRGYYYLIKRFPFLWSLAYRITYSRNLSVFNNKIGYIINRINTKGFKQLLLTHNPQIILATHFLPCEIAGFLKKNNKINSRLICIITDFNVHPFWVNLEVDAYTVAGEYAKKELISNGITQDKIRITGIPIDLKFSRIYDRGFICDKLGIKKDRFTALVVTAGFGLGPIEKIVDLLYRDVQLLTVCGNNRKLYRKLVSRSYPQVKIFGFLDNIEELMAVSDVIITKPGGLTISESLAMELPMVFISAIYGQETKNTRLLENCGVATTPRNLVALKEQVFNYKNNPGRLNMVKEKINKIKKPYAVKEICQCFLPR